jgi:hypothetical protein
MYIEDFLPLEFYLQIKECCIKNKYSKNLGTRKYDNKSFINLRFNLEKKEEKCIEILYNLFMDLDIKLAFLQKFYNIPKNTLENITNKLFVKEFEFVYTDIDKFQTIHVDIPAKFLSFVFYIPEITSSLTTNDEYKNGTILYDENLNPIYKTKYKDNSISIFAPHFYSYHGFNTTIINRNTLILFYYKNDLLFDHENSSIDNFKKNIKSKIINYPLLEYQNINIDDIFHKSKINNPSGRIIKNDN